jgi:hypothetical protein
VRRYLKILKSKRPLKDICRDAPAAIRSVAALDLKIKGMVAEYMPECRLEDEHHHD